MSNTIESYRPTIFITGASSGIGEALANVYSHRKANIAITARRADRLESLKRTLEKNGANVLVAVCDVTDEGSVKAAMDVTKEKFGKIDCVYANAGFGVTELFENLSNEDYRRQFETNIFGVLNTARYALPHLLESNGRLAIMGSVSSYVCTPADSPYSMSKAAVRALADTLYLEYKPKGVSVTFIAPGFVKSEIRHKDNNEKLNADSPDMAPAWAVMETLPAAEQMVSAVESREREFVVTAFGKFIVLFRRIFPTLALSVVASAAKKIDRRRKS